MAPKTCVWDFLNHFPLPTQYRYRFITLLAGAQGLFAHPVYGRMNDEVLRY
jgi:hypothetical protein